MGSTKAMQPTLLHRWRIGHEQASKQQESTDIKAAPRQAAGAVHKDHNQGLAQPPRSPDGALQRGTVMNTHPLPTRSWKRTAVAHLIMLGCFVAILAAVSLRADAQVVTKCTDGRDIIVVEGYQCPYGWWPTY